MAAAPATTSFQFRRWMFRLAWLLLAASLLIPAPSGLSVPGPFGLSAVHIYGKAIAWSNAAPGSPEGLGFWQGAIIGLVLWPVVPKWITLARDLGRGVDNLRARRPLLHGAEPVDVGEVFDFLRLTVWALGIIIPTAGVIIIAGGGAFGGAGALIHW